MECSLPGSSVHGDSPGKNAGVGCHALLQGIFPTQGLNPGFLHCRCILYHLSHQRSPIFILRSEGWEASAMKSHGEEPGRLQSIELQELDMTKVTEQKNIIISQWLLRKDKYSGCKYRTPERIEYQLQLANKVALQGIMPEKYRMSSVMGRIE